MLAIHDRGDKAATGDAFNRPSSPAKRGRVDGRSDKACESTRAQTYLKRTLITRGQRLMRKS